MSSGIHSIATSALLANQRALATVGHNIANAATEGYSRQRAELAASAPGQNGFGYLGTGVEVASITRAYDRFVAEQFTGAISAEARFAQLSSLSAQVDDLLADPKAGLMPALDRFHAAMEDLSSDPASSAARSSALAEVDALAARFRGLDGRLGEIADRTDQGIAVVVAEINSHSSALARLNGEIVSAAGRAGGQPPNDLLDERDRLLGALAERIGINTVAQDNGAVDVFLGRGQALVLNTSAVALAAPDRTTDPAAAPVTLAGSGAAVDPGALRDGGRLAGLLEFEARILEPARSALGRIALGVAETTNAAHRLGLDLDGLPGGDLFVPVANRARNSAASDNSGSAALQVSVLAVGELGLGDYELRRSGASTTLTRLTDGTTTDVTAALAGGPPATAEVDGMAITLTSGTLADGGRFLIQPSSGAAAAMQGALTDGRRLAAAGPLRAATALDNLGSAAITQPEASSVAGLPLAASGGPITLTFDAANSRFDVSGGPGGTLAFDPAVDAGGVDFTLTGPGAMGFRISGLPADGDVFVISDNSGGRGDNRTALALAGTRSELLLDGGNASLGDAYGALVSGVANRTREAQIGAEAEGVRLASARNERDAVAGVNLDEEAADLLRYQQAYQAAARVVAVADDMFDALLRAVGG